MAAAAFGFQHAGGRGWQRWRPGSCPGAFAGAKVGLFRHQRGHAEGGKKEVAGDLEPTD